MTWQIHPQLPEPEPPPQDESMRFRAQRPRFLNGVMEERNLVQQSPKNQITSTLRAQARYCSISDSNLKGLPWEPPKKRAEKIIDHIPHIYPSDSRQPHSHEVPFI